MSFTMYPLFEGPIATSTTKYIGVPVHDGTIGLHIGWKDATSNATITLELTSLDPLVAPVDEAGSAWEWLDSGETITGPSASAAGGTSVHLENVRQRRARLKIVTSAACDFVISDGAA